jgi:transposase InsO family protein
MDLWGKYEINSINGGRYYIPFVVDYSRHISVRFPKANSEAAQQVKDYIAHLKASGKSPRAIRSDRGKEFVNDNLRNWCDEQGIEMQLTGPYSPAQNGVAERMNRTLVELARAMLTASNLPEFLWEHAVEHAAYLRNISYTRLEPGSTPYERWCNETPDVTHPSV